MSDKPGIRSCKADSSSALGRPALQVKLRLFAAGYCLHPEWVTIRGGSLRKSRIPALFACIEHPRFGVILVDTGYAGRFLEQTDGWPEQLYRRITPVIFQEGDSAANQLQACGIEPEQVRAIVITHFHADHVAGLRDFPNAEFLYAQEAYDAVKRLSGWGALRRAFLPGLLPEQFERRSRPISRENKLRLPADFPFPLAMDVLGDGSLLAVDLPGHADGQLGLLLSTGRHDYFLCADATWSCRAFRQNRPPHPVAGLVMPDRRQYSESFRKIVQLHENYPALRIVPSHCPEIWEHWVLGGQPL